MPSKRNRVTSYLLHAEEDKISICLQLHGPLFEVVYIMNIYVSYLCCVWLSLTCAAYCAVFSVT